MPYCSVLNTLDTEKAILEIKSIFQRELASILELTRVSAPRFLEIGTGLQDDLAGTCDSVKFKLKDGGAKVELVHSLAKWKRYALGKYSLPLGKGIYTDMDAVRKDEKLDAIHSVYVDQYDWEKCIPPENRTLSYLKKTVSLIYEALTNTERALNVKFPALSPKLPPKIFFIHSENLLSKYPSLNSKEREKAIAKEYGAVFLIGIGHILENGEPHDLRAVDYDDWSTETTPGYYGLNGDILVWDAVRKDVLELSSMGIRVDKLALKEQALTQKQKIEIFYHQMILHSELPLSIGGGIGQSRLAMFLLEKAHIGEVQVSYWPREMLEKCAEKGIVLL